MPDITKCNDEQCKQRLKCWRFVSIPWQRGQSYFAESPRKGEECGYFWEHKRW